MTTAYLLKSGNHFVPAELSRAIVEISTLNRRLSSSINFVTLLVCFQSWLLNPSTIKTGITRFSCTPASGIEVLGTVRHHATINMNDVTFIGKVKGLFPLRTT